MDALTANKLATSNSQGWNHWWSTRI